MKCQNDDEEGVSIFDIEHSIILSDFSMENPLDQALFLFIS